MSAIFSPRPASPARPASQTPPRRRLTGYWLMLPAGVWLGLFFVIRALTRPPVGNQAGQPAPA